MRPVLRMGDEARVCLVIPEGTSREAISAVRINPSLQHEDGDDAVDGMGLYEKGGAVATWCGQLALYDLQGVEGELTPTCLACIARV